MVEDDKIQNIKSPKIVLNKYQKDLLSELRNISDLCASLYLDIIKLVNIDFLDNKSILVGNLMRELDSGVRAALGYEEPPEEVTDHEIDEIHEILKFEFKQKGFGEPERPTGYIKSLCKIIDKEKNFNLIKEWALSGSQLNQFAHRKEFHLGVTPFHLINDVWERYQNVLFQIFGSPMTLLSIFDKFLTQDTPTQEQLQILKNLLEKPNYQSYFYSNLKKLKWLKELKHHGFFNPVNNPKPKPSEDGKGYYIIQWRIFKYLEWVSSNLPEDDDNLIKELMDIIDKIIEYKEEGKRINNHSTDVSVYKILSNVPSRFLTPTHIDFIKDSLATHFHLNLISAKLSGKGGIISKLISEDNKAILLRLIDVVCSYVKINRTIQPLMEEYWFAEFVKVHKEELVKYSGDDIWKIIIKKIGEIKKEDPHSFSIVQIPTIEAHEQKTFEERYQSQLIDFLVEWLIHLSDEEIKPAIQDLLESDIGILKRVGFYLIGKKFDILNELFFNLKYNPLDAFNSKHELYELLRSNAPSLSDKQIDIVIKWIEEQKYNLTDIKDKEKYIAGYKKEWYHALLPSKNKKVEEAYAKYHKINDADISHPGFIWWSTTWSGESTPMEELQIEKSSVDELVKAINDFKEEKEFGKPSIRGFADEIERDVEKQPGKYSESLDKFKEVDLVYTHSILMGFTSLGTKNINSHKIIVELDWEKILNFINELINEEFWNADHVGEFNYKEWFIAESARLIEVGTARDETAFDVKLLPIAKEILIKLTKHDFFHPANTDDPVNFTLNSTEGKILEAMFRYSVRVYRQVEKKFDDEIKDHFTKRLNEKKYLEVFTTLGQYLPQFNTLDKEWVSSKTDLIFPIDDDKILNASISGLFFNQKVYPDFYRLLKEKGIYQKLIESWANNNRNINEKLVGHLCLGYVEKWEEIEDNSMIKELLDKYDALDEVVRFFWMISKKIKPENKSRVKALWQYIANNNPNKQILGKSLDLLDIFDELDSDLLNLCMIGARHVAEYHVHYVIERLLKFLDDKHEEVGKILLEIVSSINIISDYKKEDVIKIVETLYNEGKKQLANDICNQYFDKQNLLFLRELYNRNNQ